MEPRTITINDGINAADGMIRSDSYTAGTKYTNFTVSSSVAKVGSGR